jgi:hypothetical protein
LSVFCNNFDTYFDSERREPNFCMGTSKFDQSCILSLQSYPESLRSIEKCLKKVKEFSKCQKKVKQGPKRLKSKRRTKAVDKFLSMWSIQVLIPDEQTDGNYFFR